MPTTNGAWAAVGTYPAISLMIVGNPAVGNCRADKISVVREGCSREGRAIGMGRVKNRDQLPSRGRLRAQHVFWRLVARCVAADNGRENRMVSWSRHENRLLVKGSVVGSRHRREQGGLKSKGDLIHLLLFLLTSSDNAVDGTDRGNVVLITHPIC